MSVEHFGQVQVTVEEKNIAGETIQLYSSVESLNRLANAMISKTEGSYEVNGMEFTGYTATKQDSVLGAAKVFEKCSTQDCVGNNTNSWLQPE
ncbi:hypothetical protein V6N11_003706 [Hibiscus sabdariffa]|uniref:Uncharacterized protein n=1 Tax=Hibiscus sabdariffa TaxID=183260 RepID=A0ABR2SE79_9ROSI